MSRGWVIGAATLSAFRRRGCSFRRVLAVSTGDQDLRFTRDVEKRQVWEFLDGGRARGLKVEAGDTFRGRPNPTPE